MRTASVTRAMHPKVSSEAEVDCTRIVIAAVRAGLQPFGPKTGGCTILQSCPANENIRRLFFSTNSKTTVPSYGSICRDRVLPERGRAIPNTKQPTRQKKWSQRN